MDMSFICDSSVVLMPHTHMCVFDLSLRCKQLGIGGGTTPEMAVVSLPALPVEMFLFSASDQGGWSTSCE